MYKISQQEEKLKAIRICNEFNKKSLFVGVLYLSKPRRGDPCLPGTSFRCRNVTFLITAILVFSKPSLVPLLAAFISWVIWAGGREGPGGSRQLWDPTVGPGTAVPSPWGHLLRASPPFHTQPNEEEEEERG